jgi:hypothetical protein
MRKPLIAGSSEAADSLGRRAAGGVWGVLQAVTPQS